MIDFSLNKMLPLTENKIYLYKSLFQQNELFSSIAKGIEERGYCIIPKALPELLTIQLYKHIQQLDKNKFDKAGIGRNLDLLNNKSIRADTICWINGESEAGYSWLSWISELKDYLNKSLYLGLFSFESHFSHYQTGDFYKRHYDAFKGDTNRILTIVTYFNTDWNHSHGGELKIYLDNEDKDGIIVEPRLGTLVAFMSEDFPHEVLTVNDDRYSIAGWFRINSSLFDRVDPPH
ncbi:MAG: 2OG-Fe(II) oxygenase [Gammaproteobacteria bacterium]|nr:2OG-Fe(II) oxygenase [Gammaproteobacteria bacterium]